MTQIYIIIAIAALAIIAGLLIFTKRISSKSKLSPLAGLAFIFIIAGIVFNGNQLVGYGLMGAGIILAIADIFNKYKKNG